MNSEGVSSLAVVDTQYNVIGNISNIDVKVNNSISLTRQSLLGSQLSCRSAPHQIQFRTLVGEHLHPFRYRYSLDAWHGRRPGFISGLPCQSPFYARTYGCKAGCHYSPQVRCSNSMQLTLLGLLKQVLLLSTQDHRFSRANSLINP